MDIYTVLRGLFLIHIIDRGPWIAHAKKAKEMNSLQELSTCLEEVFHIPTPSVTPDPISTPEPPPTTTTPAPIPRCIYTDGEGNPEVWLPEHGRIRRSTQHGYISRKSAQCINTDGKDSPQSEQHRKRRSTQLESEFLGFQTCICHQPEEKCHFSLMETDYNISTLVRFFGYPMYTHRAILTYQHTEYQCRVHDDFIIYCRRKLYHLPKYDDGFKEILDCMSTALELHICEPETTPVGGDTGRTTARNPLSIEAAGLSNVGFIILILGCVLSVLLGIIGTVCGVMCCRKIKRKKKRYEEPRVIYSTADDRVHAEMTDAELELLNQRSRGPDVINTSPEDDKPRRILNRSTLGSLFNLAAASEGYQPVSDADDNHYEEISPRDDNYEPLQEKNIRNAKTENTYSPMSRKLRSPNNTESPTEKNKSPTSEDKHENMLRYRRNSR